MQGILTDMVLREKTNSEYRIKFFHILLHFRENRI